MFASRMSKIDASGIRKVFDLAAKMTNPINFSIGQPDFDVPDPIKTAAIDAIKAGKNKYTVTQGIPQLREKIKEHVRASNGYTPEEIIITSGVSGGLLLLSLALIEPGDEVIIPDPYFVMYKHHVNLCGGVPVFVDTYPDFKLTAERISEKITDKTKLILLNSPCNPTGCIVEDGQLEKIAQVAKKNDILVISDEIYDRFMYLDTLPSITKYLPEAILLGGFSKTYAMTGWRMGYACGPKDILNKITMLQQYSFVCAPSMAQEAGIVALDVDVSEHVASYKKKRDMVYDGLKDDFSIVKPEGSFYMFPQAPWGTAAEFVEEAIRNNVLIIPGSVFSERDTHFRISYATTDEQIERGVEILTTLARKKR